MSEDKKKKRTNRSLPVKPSASSDMRILIENLQEIHLWESHIIEKIVKQVEYAKKTTKRD